MKTLIIGAGATGGKIAGMAKLEPARLIEFYELRDLDHYKPEGDPAGAKEWALRLIADVNERGLKRVIYVGKATASAFDVKGLEVLKWAGSEVTPRAIFAILPHPALINHWYDKAENRLAASRFLVTELADREHQPPRAAGSGRVDEVALAAMED